MPRIARTLLACALLAALPARAEIVDGVAVVVNGEVVTLSEVEERVGPSLPPPGGGEALERRRRELIQRAAEDLVAERLVTREASQLGLMPAEAEVDGAIAEVMRSNNIDQRTLEYALAQQGLSMKRYREMLTLQLARMKLIEMKVKARIQVSEDDVKARYAKLAGESVSAGEELRVRDIYVPKGDDAAAARAKIEAARARVVKGESFEKVAREVGGPLASSGGDLGWVRRGMVLPEIEAAAFALKPGGLSPVVDGGSGFHLVAVEERRSVGGARPLSEAREQLRQQLLGERLQKATDEYIAELRRNADVEFKLP
jgi:peptidyl-prolyl cis-trans isomerase SurA